jgi:Flp pilus assembly protein TadD
MKKLLCLITLLINTACVQVESQTAPKGASRPNFEFADKEFAGGNYKKAVALYKELITDDDKDSEHIFKYAEALRLSGDTKLAIKYYDKVYWFDPNALYALEGKSLCYVQQADFKKAAELLGEVINKDATRWRAINALGIINASIGHLPEAMEYYDMALQISNNNPVVLNNIGLTLAFSGDFAKGKAALTRALAQLSDADLKKKQLIEYNLALVYGMSGDMKSAENILYKYLTKPEVLNNLGFYATLAKDDKLAKSYLTKAISENPVHYEKAWDNLKSIDPRAK